MSIAWTTVAVFFLLLPGFFFFFGLYVPEKFSRDVGPQSPFTHLAGIVSLSVLLHALGLAALDTICGTVFPCVRLDIAFAILQLTGADKYPLWEVADVVEKHWFWIGSYFFFLSVLGALLGWLVGHCFLRFEFFRGAARFRWVLALLADKNNKLVQVYVLSKTGNEKRIMYRGFLNEISVSKDGQINYLTLLFPARFFMDLSKDVPTTTDPKKWKVIGVDEEESDELTEVTESEVTADSTGEESTAPGEVGDTYESDETFLLLPGSDIANVIFETIQLPKSPNWSEALLQDPHLAAVPASSD